MASSMARKSSARASNMQRKRSGPSLSVSRGDTKIGVEEPGQGWRVGL